MEKVSKQLDKLWEKGIKSLAIAFVHSYLWGDHEELVAQIARDKGFEVSVSSSLQPMVCPPSLAGFMKAKEHPGIQSKLTQIPADQAGL